MPIDTDQLLHAVAIIADERNMRVAVREAGKGSLLCAATCFIGGLVAGPPGLAVGGTLGGLAAMAMTNGKFKPVSEIIKYDLTPQQRKDLVDRVVYAVRQIDATDISLLLPILLSNESVKLAVFRTITSFVTNQLHQQIAQ